MRNRSPAGILDPMLVADLLRRGLDVGGARMPIRLQPVMMQAVELRAAHPRADHFQR